MRICFVTERFPIKGFHHTEYGYMWPLFRAIAQRGHDVTVVTNEDSPTTFSKVDNVNIHYVEKIMTRNFGTNVQESLYELFDQLQTEKPFDIVHCADHSAHYFAKHRRNIKGSFAVDVRATNLDRLFGAVGLIQEKVSSYIRTGFSIGWHYLKTYWKYDRRVLKSADGIFAVSEQQRILLERYYYVAYKRVYVIPFGVETPELIATTKDFGIARSLGIPEGSQIVVTVSEFDEVGALKNLISAFERVAVKKPNAMMIVVGNGPKAFDVEGHTLQLALGNRVFFATTDSDEAIKDYINLADVYINLESRSSGLEPSVLQAMANRKFVIASEVGTSATVIENGVDGYLVHPTVTDEIARLVLDALNSHLDSETIGANAHQKVIKMFDHRRMVDKTISAYEQILKTRKKLL